MRDAITPAILATYYSLFISRPDTFALQQPDGCYYRVTAPISELLLQTHLTGRLTAGFYALSASNTCRWACIEADNTPGWDQLLQLRATLTGEGLPTHLEYSRRGGHLWLFLADPLPATILRGVLLTFIHRLKLSNLELYPRQDTAQFGSLMRGPLGIHRLTGKCYNFTYGGPIAKQIEQLKSERASAQHIQSLYEPETVSIARAALFPRPTRHIPLGGPIAQINTQLDIWELASAYTQLNPHTGKGRCPLHPPDRHPSFWVNRDEETFCCFHGRDGQGRHPLVGDAFQLYCEVHHLTHRQGILALAHLLK